MKNYSSLSSALIFSIFCPSIHSHGATSYPPSRQWLCSGGASPNMGVYWNGGNGANVCSPQISGSDINNVITDWSGVAQGFAGGQSNKDEYEQDPRSAHIKVMGDGLDSMICSGNLGKYDALNENSWAVDQGPGQGQSSEQPKDGNSALTSDYYIPYPSKMKNGPNQFTYSVSAPHKTYNTGYIDFYITKDSTDFSKPLTWNDLEEAPFCHYVPSSDRSPLQTAGFGNVEEFQCEIPEEKIGQHVLFSVWQRADSDEAFYSCSDVVLENFQEISPKFASRNI